MTPFSNSNPVEPSAGSQPKKSPAKSDPNANSGCLIFLGGLFALMGLAMLIIYLAIPVKNIIIARSWGTTPCQITSSMISTHYGKNDNTYSADISFSYVLAGQSYTSDTYSFGHQSSGGYQRHLNLVNAYPPGMRTVCYVNPANPAQAVLNRGFTSDVASGLFSIPFMLFGLGFIWLMRRSQNTVRNPRAQWKPATPIASGEGPLVLTTTSSPLGRCVGLGFISLFWNGLVGFMGFHIITAGGFFSVFGVLFFLPFFAVGLLIFGAFIQNGLSLANAKPVLTLSQPSLRVGVSAQLQFELRGGFFTPQNLEIVLEGREIAIFRRGTDEVTDKSTFFLQTLVQDSGRSGGCTVTIPSGTMHSFEAPHNKILWVLRAKGPIPRWPDISEEWKITVEPGT